MSEVYKTEFTLNGVNDASWSATEVALIKKIIDHLQNTSGGNLTFTAAATAANTQVVGTIGAEYGYVDILSWDTGVAGVYEYSRNAFCGSVPGGTVVITEIFKVTASDPGAEHTVTANSDDILVACSHAGTSQRQMVYGFFKLTASV